MKHKEPVSDDPIPPKFDVSSCESSDIIKLQSKSAANQNLKDNKTNNISVSDADYDTSL